MKLHQYYDLESIHEKYFIGIAYLKAGSEYKLFKNTLTLISNAPWIHLAISLRNIIRLLRNSPVIQINLLFK